MAKFEVPVVRIRALEPIPGADMIELAVVGDYRSVVQKGLHVVGGLAAYIPEGALLPQDLLSVMGLEGRLAGSEKNRVKAIKLRGCLSQGVLIPSARLVGDDYAGTYLFADPVESSVCKIPTIKVEEGQDVAEHFGIMKWEPPIPANMGGEVYNAGQKLTVHYDVENFKKFPDVLQEGEQVHITEKLHGCVARGTLIMLPNGEMEPIENVVADDSITHVMSFDVDTLQYMPKLITGRMNRPNLEAKQWVRLTLENGRTVTMTKDHPVYSRDRHQYINACDILTGEDIESPIL